MTKHILRMWCIAPIFLVLGCRSSSTPIKNSQPNNIVINGWRMEKPRHNDPEGRLFTKDKDELLFLYSESPRSAVRQVVEISVEATKSRGGELIHAGIMSGYCQAMMLKASQSSLPRTWVNVALVGNNRVLTINYHGSLNKVKALSFVKTVATEFDVKWIRAYRQ